MKGVFSDFPFLFKPFKSVREYLWKADHGPPPLEQKSDNESERDYQEYNLHLSRRCVSHYHHPQYSTVIEQEEYVPNLGQMAKSRRTRRIQARTEFVEKIRSRAEWALSDTELEAIVRHLGGRSELRLSGLIEYNLKDKWSYYMDKELFMHWREWLFGREEDHDISNSYRHLCQLLKSHNEGTLSSKAAIISKILLRTDLRSTLIDKELDVQELSRYFQAILLTYFNYLYYHRDVSISRWCSAFEGRYIQRTFHGEEIVEFYLPIIQFKGSLAKVLHILETSPMLDHISSLTVAVSFGYGRYFDCIPRLVKGESTFLGISTVTFLSYLVKGHPDQKFKWEMLYNSKIHGDSYYSFYKRVKGETSTFIFIKEEFGFIFSAYIKQWHTGNKFFGKEGIFLCKLHPKVVIMPPSGLDENYCYFNFNTKGSPIGLAFGGTKEFFGIHIDFETRRGISADACKTYENFECLTKHNFFTFTDMEVWSVLPDWRKHKVYKACCIELEVLAVMVFYPRVSLNPVTLIAYHFRHSITLINKE